MTSPNPDSLDAYLDAYLDYLEGAAPRPDLDGLDVDDRRDAQELTEMMEAGRGLDPKTIVGTSAYKREVAARDEKGAVVGELAPIGPAARVAAALRSFDLDVERDVAAASPPVVASDLLVNIDGVKLRARVLGSTVTESLVEPDTLEIARLVLARFVDTIAVVVVLDDDGYTSLVLDAFDVNAAIEVPTGGEAGPRPRRRPLPLDLAIAAYREEISPPWDDLPVLVDENFDDFSIESTARAAAAAAVGATVAEGRRAHEPRRSAWTRLEEDGTADGLGEIVAGVYGQRVEVDQVRDELERLGGEAA